MIVSNRGTGLIDSLWTCLDQVCITVTTKPATLKLKQVCLEDALKKSLVTNRASHLCVSDIQASWPVGRRKQFKGCTSWHICPEIQLLDTHGRQVVSSVAPVQFTV